MKARRRVSGPVSYHGAGPDVRPLYVYPQRSDRWIVSDGMGQFFGSAKKAEAIQYARAIAAYYAGYWRVEVLDRPLYPTGDSGA